MSTSQRFSSYFPKTQPLFVQKLQTVCDLKFEKTEEKLVKRQFVYLLSNCTLRFEGNRSLTKIDCFDGVVTLLSLEVFKSHTVRRLCRVFSCSTFHLGMKVQKDVFFCGSYSVKWFPIGPVGPLFLTVSYFCFFL